MWVLLIPLSWVYLKILRVFLRTCWWVIVKMSVNRKHSGSNGTLSGNLMMMPVKKTREESTCEWNLSKKFILVCILGLVIGFIAFSSGFLRPKVGTLDLAENKDGALVEQFNVSKGHLHALADLFFESDQITSFTCFKMPRQRTLAKDVSCSIKVTCSNDEEFINQHSLLAADVQLLKQCPVPDEDNNSEEPSLELPGDDSSSFCSDSTTSAIRLNEESSEHIEPCDAESTHNSLKVKALSCVRFPFCSAKGYWWASLGVLLGCITSFAYVKLWGFKGQESLQEQPRNQQQSSSRSAGNWRKKLLLIFVLAGVIGSLWLFVYLNRDFNFRRKETISNMCEERARMLQDQFNVSMNHVHALALLVSTFHHGKQPSAIDQKTFAEYTQRTSFERPLTSGVSYALRVLHSEREEFEKHHGWPIRKMEEEDQTLVQDCNLEQLDPAPLNDEYAPVIFAQATVSYIVSIDMMSGKADRENILRARATGKGVLTSPLNLLKLNHLGVVLTFAVYNTHLPPDATEEERINATVGYLGASYDMPSLVEKLLHQLAEKQTIVVNVYDTTDKNHPINMYGDDDAIDTGLLHQSSLDFGDPARKHEMHCRFKQQPPLPWTAITFAVGVFVITLLLGHIFYAAINRIAEVEHDYREMMELKHRAEAADIAKSQFLATVSHEIRTPMNGVLGMLQLLMGTELDASQMDYAQTAHASGNDLISLINEVLDQAKIESGRLDLESVPFDLRAVLDNVLSLHFGKSHEKKIELAVYVSNQVPLVVVGDPGRFRQIITNLVGNSIKFTQDRGHIFVSVHIADEAFVPIIEVRDEVLRQSSHNSLSGFPVVDRWKSWENFKNVGSADSSGDNSDFIKLLVSVEDTGVGIPLEAQSRIFTPFMQADSSTSRTYGGTGIGLSISKRLVDLMGGEIGFMSEPGVGTTFSFTAALKKGEISSLDTERLHIDPASSEFRGLKALVVDDKVIRAEVSKYHLQRLGMSADIAFSLDSAYDVLSSISNSSESPPFPMVLVDKDVWGMNTTCPPFQFLVKELREKEKAEDPTSVPRLFLLATAITQNERTELKSAYPVDYVLTKPLRLSVLISCFQEVLGFDRRVHRVEPSDNKTVLREKHILVVDDNDTNRKVAEFFLRFFGAVVTCVNSGKAAVEMLKPPHNFDACFMDLQMPEMDGFEATREIRSLECNYNERTEAGEAPVNMFADVVHWHTPIVAMTADVIQASNEQCLESGMDGYVTKPLKKEHLYWAVSKFFDSE